MQCNQYKESAFLGPSHDCIKSNSDLSPAHVVQWTVPNDQAHVVCAQDLLHVVYHPICGKQLLCHRLDLEPTPIELHLELDYWEASGCKSDSIKAPLSQCWQ